MDLENEYQKKDHVEHIYDLPDTYTGSIESTEVNMFVLDENKTKMRENRILYVPGFFKIFDEILVNALDHKQRDPENCKTIKINFDVGKSEITIWNDGKGIDIEKHPVYDKWIPEMLFGELLTSTNYDKEQKRIVGGKNGYGAKLTNIFSKKFKIETVDAIRKKKYVQIFEDNMKVKKEPTITNSHSYSKPYTCITFLPDYNKFNMPDGISSDTYLLMEKRVYDSIAFNYENRVEPFQIYLNDEKLKVKGFSKYVEMYLDVVDSFYVVDESQTRWKVALANSQNMTYMDVSFVNGIWTMKGGKHVDYVLNQIIDKIKEFLSKYQKTKSKVFKNSQIKEHLWLFLSCIIENPSFTSQTKEEMSTKHTQFGSKWVCDDKFIEKFVKGPFLERILESIQATEEKTLKKSDGNKKNIVRVPKLEDANYAGTKKSLECTLILTEGDSAKASALSGLSVHGPSFRDTFGVFPLKGKFLNVRDANTSQIMSNEEIKNLKQILGLQQGKEYTKENLHELRYGSVSLMTDQDSVTGDTPILMSVNENNNNKIIIKSIENIEDSPIWLLDILSGKEFYFPRDETFVWTNSGWSQIKKVIRHKIDNNEKKIYKLISKKGVVDVTEDHSLLDHLGNKITVKQVKTSTRLLYSFPFQMKDSSFSDKLEVFVENNKYNAQIRFMLESIKGNQVEIDYDNEKDIYHIVVNRFSYDPFVIEKIIEQKYTESHSYVYDLETHNHQFQAGVGELIVHNTDGSHIKGLVMNFFHHFFPSLLKIDGFFKSYITPIVRGFKGKQTIDFYTLSDYHKFKNDPTTGGNTFHYKYYKGLGTSSSKEMQEYFKKMNNITILYDDAISCDECIELAFKKNKTHERKDWLKSYDPSETIEYKKENHIKRVSIEDFIHKDLKHFSNADNIRSIPNYMDGLKPSQRKVLYGTFLKCGVQNTSIKVAQLSGHISEKTCYHHGEMSLEQTIVNMAQNFVGSNNINWLKPEGMFGTRLKGGKDHASSRYIFTKLQEITFYTFRKEDSLLYKYNDDDGILIEPVEYYPVVPNILINGCQGIGTGYSTFVPCFNPLEIAQECINFTNGADMKQQLLPWYHGFRGKINQVNESFSTEGIMEVHEQESKIIIKELPVGEWTENYKEFLEEQMYAYLEFKKKSKMKGLNSNNDCKYNLPITGVVNKSTDTDINFEITYECSVESIHEIFSAKNLRLINKISCSNMYLYVDNVLQKFNSATDILKFFCEKRLEKYNIRKDKILADMKNEYLYLNEKIRFLYAVIDGSLVIFKTKTDIILKNLEKLKFKKKESKYDYLIKMPIDKFTLENILELEKERELLVKKISDMEKMSCNEIWKNELIEWIQEYEKYIKLRSDFHSEIEQDNDESQVKKKSKKQKKI